MNMQAVTAVADFGQRVQVQVDQALIYHVVKIRQITGILESADSTGLTITDARTPFDRIGPVFIPWAHVVCVMRDTSKQDKQP